MSGYGSSLVRQAMEGQLGGSVSYEWTKRGAAVTLVISGDCIAD